MPRRNKWDGVSVDTASSDLQRGVGRRQQHMKSFTEAEAEITHRWDAFEVMLEALRAVESEITRLEGISKQAFSIDEVHPAVDRVATAARAAIAKAVERDLSTIMTRKQYYAAIQEALERQHG